MELGQMLLIGCFFCSLIAIISSYLKPIKFEYPLMFWAYIGSLFLITAATALLIYYLINGDYRYSYVYQHTSSDLPLIYRISALWSGQEGSFLLWSCIAFWMNLFVRRDYKVNKVYQIICCGLVCLACFSQPFATLNQKPLEGLGLSTALRNPWMVLHPPIVFISYTAMAIVFSQSFNRVSKKWIILSWSFLGVGLLTGSIWAYQALGWGGFWAWDPIENLALVPWLLLSIYVHENEVTIFKARIPFLLAVFGTFMVRSGILAKLSVHSYASSKFGIPIFIVFISLFIIVLMGFIKSKSHLFKRKPSLKPRDLFKILMYIFSLAVLVGTLCPIITGENTPIVYFNTVAMTWAIIYSLLFILYKAHQDQRIFILGLVVDVVFVIIISITTQQFDLWALLILYCVFIPLILQVLSIKRIKKQALFIEMIHIGLSLLIVCIIVSSLFGYSGLWLKHLTVVEGRTTIIHQLFGDIIVHENGYFNFKPMITGVFIGAGLMCIGGFFEAFKKRNVI